MVGFLGGQNYEIRYFRCFLKINMFGRMIFVDKFWWLTSKLDYFGGHLLGSFFKVQVQICEYLGDMLKFQIYLDTRGIISRC